MEIRELRPEEAQAWFCLRRRLWPDTSRGVLVQEMEKILADKRGNAVLVASLGDDLVGFVEVALRDWAEGCTTCPVGYVEAWYVQPEHQRSGLGRRLMEAAERWASSRGCTEMGSDSELGNETSIHAHRALGYTEVVRLVLFSRKILSPRPGTSAATGGGPMRRDLEGLRDVSDAAQISFLAVAPQFSIPDIVRTAEYYRDVLGFSIAGYWDGARQSLAAETPQAFAIVRRGDVQLFFNRADQAGCRSVRADGAYDAYLRVRGIDALAEELRLRGANILEGPTDRSYGQRELVVRDCNGLIMAFGEETCPRAV